MPRIRRAVAAGFPHHVIQRGNNREFVFFYEEDRKKYLSLLKKYSVKWKSPIISYCLMSNHIHLLTILEKDSVLGREDYILLLHCEIPREEIDRLRYATRTGRPFGNEVFVVEMEKKLERRLLNSPRGRPKKELP